MLLRLLSPAYRPSSAHSSAISGKQYRVRCVRRSSMTSENLFSKVRKPANSRLCNVSSYTTELLEIEADDRKLHVLFIPGNPGVIAFYKDFLEALFELLDGVASITAIGHISHTKRDWENGRLFSMQDQIDHKIDFIRQELRNSEVPIILVGHSIGSYISIETLKRLQEKVIYCIALYPFLALNPISTWQPIIGTIAASSFLSAVVSFIVALLGMLPKWALRLIVLKSFGRSWSSTAVEAACSQLPRLLERPDWTFMRGSKDKITFLFGDDDHWGPLQMFEEISEQVPNIAISVEREGYTHNFSCTEAGSVWVAQHVANLIKSQIPTSGK
ncbi:lipid droplet-associated hydrolase isoform X1 [Jatropha curcas]|uniref:lipid droplet-associated hydrolase isoform X1 n=1 Tax=Jatropha curcas TaxID=180498 RepID=UPI0005FBA79C|nr:lipid droplet-associated hydrolase isoform X1 [Jatropha curcas]XP_020535677.1 lipid droplet-associated hydrolase isoform X1 [Jatropha curcas]XP_020535678.1 lipid droplet-associated hydrolase isoform X1 [Jatropha curcas]